MEKVCWRLKLEFAWRDDNNRCEGINEWEDIENPHVTTLHFKDEKKARDTYLEALAALKKPWDDQDDPPRIRTNFAKRHDIKAYGDYGEELNYSLVLMRVVEFIKIEKIHEN